MLPHPVQFRNEIFSNAARSNSFCLVSVPQLSKSHSQPKEGELGDPFFKHAFSVN